MLPYNICENKWLSKTKIKKHLKDYSEIYNIFFWTGVMCTVILALLTAFDSFF